LIDRLHLHPPLPRIPIDTREHRPAALPSVAARSTRGATANIRPGIASALPAASGIVKDQRHHNWKKISQLERKKKKKKNCGVTFVCRVEKKKKKKKKKKVGKSKKKKLNLKLKL
jgi:hypothetical protein